MENAKSIIDIEVNDDQFKEFTRLFEKYRASLGAASKEWKDVEQSVAEASNAAKDAGESADKFVDAAEKTSEAGKEILETERDISHATEQTRKEKEKQADAAEKVSDAEADGVKSAEERERRLKDITAALTEQLGLLARTRRESETEAATQDGAQSKRLSLTRALRMSEAQRAEALGGITDALSEQLSLLSKVRDESRGQEPEGDGGKSLHADRGLKEADEHRAEALSRITDALAEHLSLLSKLRDLSKAAATDAEHSQARQIDLEKALRESEGRRTETLAAMTAILTNHLSLLSEQIDRRTDQDAAEARSQRQRIAFEKTIEASEKRQNDIIAKRQKYIKDLGASLTSMMGKTVSIGLNIAKWGVGVGLAAIGGGLFGMDRLGSTATGERSTSRMLGVTPGQLRAWRTDFAQYGDPDSLLSAASNAPTDPMMGARMQRAGVRSETIREGNTSQIAEQTLRGLTEFFNRNKGPNAQQVWAANGYDQIIGYNQMRQFAGASAEEREAMFRRLRSDQQSMGNNDRTMREWSDFTAQLERAKQQIKATFLDGLSGLTGPMSDLSKAVQGVVREFISSGAFASVIKVISQGLNDLADSLKDGSAQKAVKSFIDTLSQWAKNGTLTDDLKTIEAGIHQLAVLLKGVIPDTDTSNHDNLKSKAEVWGGAAAGAYTGSKLGGVLGAPGKVVGGVLGGAWGTLTGGIYAAKHSDYIPMRRGQQSEFYNLAISQGENPAMARYLASIAWTESRGDSKATSSKGAQGLMQLMPSVSKQYGVKDPFDKAQSMHGAVGLVNDLVKQFNGDMGKVTAAYNAGGGRVSGAIKQYGEQHWLEHMPKETQDYVGRVNANIQAGGIKIQVNNNTGGAATVTARQASTL